MINHNVSGYTASQLVQEPLRAPQWAVPWRGL